MKNIIITIGLVSMAIALLLLLVAISLLWSIIVGGLFLLVGISLPFWLAWTITAFLMGTGIYAMCVLEGDL